MKEIAMIISTETQKFSLLDFLSPKQKCHIKSILQEMF